MVIAGSAAIGSLALADGSLGVADAGVMSGTARTGATVTGCVASGVTWARSWVEERARTAAIAVMATRIFGVLWVILRGNE